MGEGTAPSDDQGGDLPLAILGVDHHRTPVDIRERLAVPPETLLRLLAGLSTLPGSSEAVVLSTCNRLECYLAGTPDRQAIVSLLAEHHGVDAAILDQHVYWSRGRQCVRHLFRVTAGLESLVIGEHQIINQVKTAYDQARAGHFTSAVLNPLFQRSLGVAKEVRNQTAIGKHKLSVASVAVDLARHIYGELSKARLLVVGAGEIAELAIKYLLSAGVRELSVINRSEERATALAAEYKAEAMPWSMLADALLVHDIVVTSTAAPHAVITEAEVRAVKKRRKAPLMFIDLAVPRDVEAEVGKLSDVFLYNIDHLEAVVAANRNLRADEVDAADALVDSLVASYVTDVRRDKGALLAQVASYFDDIIAAEEARLRGKLNLKDSSELRYGLERVGNKLQHQVLRLLRERPDDRQVEDLVRELLNLK